MFDVDSQISCHNQRIGPLKAQLQNPLSSDQETFIDALDTLLESHHFPGLDWSRVVASTDPSLTVHLPHVSGDIELIVGMDENEATISFGPDHVHLSSDDGGFVSTWLPESTSFVLATVTYVEWFLTGRIEVESHRRWYGTTTRTYLVNGERRLIQTGWIAYWGHVFPDGVYRPDYTGPVTPD